MKILIGCEESGIVTQEFLKKGHDVYSCDILPTSGNNPERHIQDDVRKYLNDNWDMIIAFPPCTHLAVSGARWFKEKREDGRQLDAIEFFADIYNSKCKKICIENPVNIIGSEYIKRWFPCYKYLPNPTQYIQPWEFGHGETKKNGTMVKRIRKFKTYGHSKW